MTRQPPPAIELSVEDEVLANIRGQALGIEGRTVADLNLPEDFLRRLADRIIRSSFEERFRIVVREGADASPPPRAESRAGAQASASEPAPDSPHPTPGPPRTLPEARPPLRGFRAPILNNALSPWSFAAPGPDAPPAVRRAAAVVAERLAHDGLLLTSAHAVTALGPEALLKADAEPVASLREVGIPVDLLECFAVKGAEPPGAVGLVRWMARNLSAPGATPESLAPRLATATFSFVNSGAGTAGSDVGFTVATESGEHEVGMLRLQATRGTHWAAEGDGGCLDLLRRVLDAFPTAPAVISVEERHAADLRAAAASWEGGVAGRITILPEPLPVAQWAQDNGKAGFVGRPGSALSSHRVATLVPRYASRGEDGSTFVPGETFLIERWAAAARAAGQAVIQSPLLFQGGDLLPVRDPAARGDRGERVLLLGEAEIHRNVALGLTPAQTIAAFTAEFGVERCVVLPAVSLHIDYEVCARVHAGRVLAFVNDTDAAVPIVLLCGLGALDRARAMDGRAAKAARLALARGQMREFLRVVVPALGALGPTFGHFPQSLADAFSDPACGAADSGVGNLQRFLLAIDIAASGVLSADEMPSDRHARAYLESFRRRDADRAALHHQLADMGWKLVRVPSFADADRSLNYLNGIHTPDRYILPVYGGIFRTLDEAATRVFHKELGSSVRITPILSSESQRRLGAVHCSVAAYPLLTPKSGVQK